MKYIKTFTREYPVVVVELWNKVFQESLAKIFGFAWTKPLVISKDGNVYSYRSVEFHEELPHQVREWSKYEENVEKLRTAIAKFYIAVEAIKKYNPEESSNIIQEIKEMLDIMLDGVTGVVACYWCVEWNEKARRNGQAPICPQDIFEKAHKLRSKDLFTDTAVDIIQRYLKAYSEKENVSLDLIKLTTLEELSVHNTNDASARKNGYFYYDRNIYPISEIVPVCRLYSIELDDEIQVNQTSEINGSMASTGYVKGKVVVIKSRSDLDKAKIGDILVAPMTTPWYLPAMEKASAFVTDEGGILCHAAIIAREIQKPCVIGTKIATKVFKDGDLVEVDATNGIVRKLTSTQ